ncbi:hypothetical protein U1Q18_045031 [Sarracenia purpurea var. burkii]
MEERGLQWSLPPTHIPSTPASSHDAQPRRYRELAKKLLKIKNSDEIASSEKVKLISSTTKKATKKGEKTKRQSQVKTQEALKERLVTKQVVRLVKRTMAGRKTKRVS